MPAGKANACPRHHLRLQPRSADSPGARYARHGAPAAREHPWVGLVRLRRRADARSGRLPYLWVDEADSRAPRPAMLASGRTSRACFGHAPHQSRAASLRRRRSPGRLLLRSPWHTSPPQASSAGLPESMAGTWTQFNALGILIGRHTPGMASDTHVLAADLDRRSRCSWVRPAPLLVAWGGANLGSTARPRSPADCVSVRAWRATRPKSCGCPAGDRDGGPRRGEDAGALATTVQGLRTVRRGAHSGGNLLCTCLSDGRCAPHGRRWRCYSLGVEPDRGLRISPNHPAKQNA